MGFRKVSFVPAILLAAVLAVLPLLLVGCSASPGELEAKREAAAGYKDTVWVSGTVLAVSREGKVYSSDLMDKTAAEVDKWEDVVQVAASSSWTAFGLKYDGSVVVADDGVDHGWGASVLEWNGIVQIACNNGGVYGLKENGTVVAAGEDDSFGRLDVSSWEGVIELYSSPTNAMMYAMTSDGRILCTHEEDRATIGTWTDIVQFDYSRGWALGLRSDGTVCSDGYGEDIAAQIAQWEGIVQVAAAGERGLAAGLKADGTVVFTGDPAEGSTLIRRDGTSEELPAEGYAIEGLEEVGDWRDVAVIDACGAHLLGLTADGRVLFAGRSGSADASELDTSGWRDVVAVYASDPSFLALRSDGTLVGYVSSPISDIPALW